MHWSTKKAQELIAKKKDVSAKFVCGAGISPSGNLHVGNFRDMATTLFVAKALQKAGHETTVLLSFDELDRLRKIPQNVKNDLGKIFDELVGYPLSLCPDPYGCCESYGAHFKAPYIEALKAFNIKGLKFAHQKDLYLGGNYREQIKTAMLRRLEICKMVDDKRTEKFTQAEREAFYPVKIICSACGKLDTNITSFTSSNFTSEYTCECGFSGTFNFEADNHCKLAWKVDWPMRWAYENTDFEPGGKDHGSEQSSYNVSKVVSKQIYNFPAPDFIRYEFIGFGGVGKMSGSTGINMTPAELLKIYTPELFLWLFARCEPQLAFTINILDEQEVQRNYLEFDRAYQAYKAGTADAKMATAVELCLIEGRQFEPIPFNLIVTLGSIVDFNALLLVNLFKKIGIDVTAEALEDRLSRAKYWAEQYVPQVIDKLLVTPDKEFFASLTESEQQEIRDTAAILKTNPTTEELELALYGVTKKHVDNTDKKAMRNRQAQFFKNAYRLLIGKEQGPRLYMFLAACDTNKVIELLDL